MKIARHTYQSIAITGASSGLGAALALGFASHGKRLFLCARRIEQLEDVAAKCRAKGAEVEISRVDVQHPDEVTNWIESIDSQQPIDLLIANAGVFGGNTETDRLEDLGDAIALINTNLSGAIAAASGMAKRMQLRRSGRIALISSLAAFYPHADAPAYSSSKAGLTAYGLALREYLMPHGVGVSLIHPGHIQSDQTDMQIGSLPMIVPVDKAAARIITALEAGRSTISFPLTLRYLVFLNQLLPWQIRALVNRPFRFTVR